jgi:hypothetical protein
MWFNCMQFVGKGPMPVTELERRAAAGPDPNEPGRHAALGLAWNERDERVGCRTSARFCWCG